MTLSAQTSWFLVVAALISGCAKEKASVPPRAPALALG
jgi:hypothetical protein